MAEYVPASYTASAAQTDFTITFEYLSEDHVHVIIDDVETSEFTIVNSGNTVRLDAAAAGGEEVVIRRETPTTTALVDFSNGAGLPEEDLDTAVLQLLYALNENVYGAGVAGGNASAIAAAASAAAAAELVDGIDMGAFTTLQTDVDTAEAAIVTLQTDLNTAEAAIDAIEAAVPTTSFTANKALVVNAGGTAYEQRRANTSAIASGTLVDGVFFEAFESTGAVVPTSGNSTSTVAHGMSLTPKIVEVWLVCQTNDGNFSAGDRIKLDMGSSATRGAGVRADATNVYIDWFNNAAPIQYISDAFSTDSLDETKWNYVIEAWAWKT